MKLWGNSHFIGSFFMPKLNSIPTFTEKYSKTSEKALTSTYPEIYNKIPFSGSYNWIPNVLEMELRRKPPNACGTLRGSTAARRQKLFCTVSGGRGMKTVWFWISKPLHRTSFWSESKAPADFWCLCNGFLFCRLQLNDRPNGIWFCDDIFLTESEQDNAAEKAGAGTTFG